VDVIVIDGIYNMKFKLFVIIVNITIKSKQTKQTNKRMTRNGLTGKKELAWINETRSYTVCTCSLNVDCAQVKLPSHRKSTRKSILFLFFLLFCKALYMPVSVSCVDVYVIIGNRKQYLA
jgi:hypothetical protein